MGWRLVNNRSIVHDKGRDRVNGIDVEMYICGDIWLREVLHRLYEIPGDRDEPITL